MDTNDAHAYTSPMQRTTGEHLDDTHVGDYDAHLAHTMAQRDLVADAHQLERDARRSDYDHALASMPITFALRTMRTPTSPTSGRVFAPKMPRIHKDTAIAHGPNAWESKADHARTHLRPDGACHHPLVKCSHKW